MKMVLNRLDEAEQILVEVIGQMKDRAADDPILVFTIGLLRNCQTTRERSMNKADAVKTWQTERARYDKNAPSKPGGKE